MAGRTVAGTLTVIVLTAVLLLLGAGLLALNGAASPGEAFLSDGPRAVVAFVGLPFVVWGILLVLVDLLGRNRTARFRFLIGVAVTLVLAAVALGFWVVFALVGQGWAAFVLAIAVLYIGLFVVAALVALAVTHLLLFRRRPAVSAATA